MASLLELKDYQIANISKNNEHNPNRAVACSTAVLEKWLKEVPSPTWGKLEDSINKLPIKKQLCNTTGMLSLMAQFVLVQYPSLLSQQKP